MTTPDPRGGVARRMIDALLEFLMSLNLENRLVVALSSRALFDFEAENRLFDPADDRPYMQLQLDRVSVAAEAGIALPLVRKLLAFNDPDLPADQRRVEVVILSRNDPASGLRVFNSAVYHGLGIERGVFTRGRAPWAYLRPLRADLFLSAEPGDVRGALEAGFAGALVFPDSARAAGRHPREVRIAFDGDAVLFSDEAERVFQAQGLDAFQNHESERADEPLNPGPFKPLLEALHRLRAERGATERMGIRVALVTARSAPAHERAIRTLMHWGVDIDEAMFLGGLDKGEFLAEFEPDFYFDDHPKHVASARLVGPTGHVMAGATNPVEA